MNKNWVLIVDDDPLILSVTEAAIAHPDLRITTASDALQAFIQAQNIKPILVISDIQMPGFGTGPDALRKMRDDPRIPKVPFIFVTGMQLEKAKLLLPADDPLIRLMPKPIDYAVLKKLVWGYARIPLT